MIDIPNDLDNSVYSYMNWNKITNQNSEQYKLRTNHESYDGNGLGDIKGRKVIACTSTFGNIGDEIEVIFKNKVNYWNSNGTLFAVIGDFKSQNDPNCDKYGHLYTKINGKYTQRSVIEFIVNSNVNNIKDIFHNLKKNPVKKIKNTGKNYLK